MLPFRVGQDHAVFLLRERLLSVPKLPLEPCAALPLRLDLGTDLLACLRAIYEVALVCRGELSAPARVSTAWRSKFALNASSCLRGRNLRLRIRTGGGRPSSAILGSWSHRQIVISETPPTSRRTCRSGTNSSTVLGLNILCAPVAEREHRHDRANSPA